MGEQLIEPGMYVRFSERVLSDDPAGGGGTFGLVGDPLAVGGFVTLRAWSGMGVYGQEDMTPVSPAEVPPDQLADLKARAHGPAPIDGM
ncbi:MAG TPA: hypothetical protein VFR07_02690 [Mycobacteriales bacterium]|jgi:hypothetical protein|nr:hypothetical protein [Mycobacteriales bacterium]